MRAFEIHVYQGGRWNIDSIFDDRDLAMHEAQRMDHSGRYVGVRVIEETFDEATDRTTTRTIFRGSRIEEENARHLERHSAARAQAQVERRRRQRRNAARRRLVAARARKSGTGLVRAFFLLILLGGLAVGALLGLDYLRALQ